MADAEESPEQNAARMAQAEQIARRFHEVYELRAPMFGYETRKATAKPWAEVPDQNKQLMVTVVAELLLDGVIISG